jgi:hypothetical protein
MSVQGHEQTSAEATAMSAFLPLATTEWPFAGGPFRANKRHRRALLSTVFPEDLALTRKDESEHDFSCW